MPEASIPSSPSSLAVVALDFIDPGLSTAFLVISA
jgi:hypothetical protein